MEFCFSDTTRIHATEHTSRGVYPAPDADPYPYPTTAHRFAASGTDDAADDAAIPADAPVTVVDAVPASNTAAVAVGADVPPPSTLAVIEPNVDIAEALQHLLQTLPGVARVATMTTSEDLLRSLATDAEVSGFAALGRNTPDVTVPEIVFLDSGKACTGSAGSNQRLRASIEELRRTLPSTALVLLSVYPDRMPSDLRGMVSASIRKDTSRQELEALVAQVRARRIRGDTMTQAAGF